MPTITLNKKVFETLVGKKLPEEKLKDRISMLGTDLESVGEKEIVVEVFPNRPDMLSEQGFARAFSSFIGAKIGLRTYPVKKSGYEVKIDPSVTMRPYSVCAIVKNVQWTDERIREVMQIQEKLAKTHGRDRKKSAYGLYPAEKINFPVTYIAKDPKKVMFHPLGFPEKIPAHKVEELHPTGKKFKDVAKGWKEYPFFIDAKENVMCMLPYTNSHDTGKIEETTKDVFIECTGNDLENVQVALNILTTMLADMGGEIYTIDMVYPDKTITTPNLTPQKMKVDIPYINKRLGLTLNEKDIEKLLANMGMGYEKGHALIPAYRADILHQCDLVEDIAIAYGYEKVNECAPNIATIGKEAPFEKFLSTVAKIMVGLQLQEVSSYHITNRKNQCEKTNVDLPVVELANALTEDYNVLRAWLVPCLLEIVQNNKHNEYPQNMFMMGRVFKEGGKADTGVVEHTRLAASLCHEQVDYTGIKQVFDYLLRMLDVQYEMQETEHASFIPGRVARVSVKGKEIAYLGEVAPEVLHNFESDMPVACFELNLTELWEVMQ